MNTSSIQILLATCALATTALAQHATEPSGQRTADELLAQAPAGFGAYQDHDGTVLADGPRFCAELSAHAASLSVPAPTVDSALPTLRLRYLGSHRGGQEDPVGKRSTPQFTDDVARYHHGNVVEAYRLRANGFEQSFHLAQRPAGDGDLIFDLAIDGNVTAPAADPKHRALEFSLGEHRAIRYGEAIAFDRGGNRIDVLTSYDGIGHLQLIVPASFVDEATFPIVVDPVVTPVFLPGDSFFPDSQPDVAYDIETDRYMVVWRRQFSATSAGIRGKIYDAEGVAVSAEFAIANGGTDTANPSVAPCNVFSPSAFLVVFEQNDRIRGRLHSTSFGTPLASQFIISTPGTGTDRRPSVSGPGTGAMMVAWDRTLVGAGNPTSIVMDHVRWPNPSVPQTVDVSPEQTLESVSTGYVQSVRLARSDVRRQVGGVSWYANRAVWQRFYTAPAPGDFDLRTISFRVKASPFDFAVIDTLGGVPGGGGIGPNEINADIGGRATLHGDDSDIQYLIAWEDEGGVLGHMMDLDGPMGAAITVQDTADFQGQPAVGAGYCEFSVGYIEIIPPAEFDVQIRAARVLLDGTVAIADRLVDDPGPQYQSGLRATSRPIHTVSEDETNRVLFAWTGETGPVTGLQDIRAAYFEPVDAFASPFGSACPGPLGELAAIGITGGAPLAGNDDFGFTVSGAPVTSLAVLVVSDQLTTTPIPGAPGCFLYAGLPLINIFPTVTDGTGFGSVGIPIPCSIPSGTSLAFQWAIYSPTANAFGWVSSNDIDLSWSHF